MSEWLVYICAKGARYYTGITTNLPHRLRQHGHPDVKYTEYHADRLSAARRERAIKGWSKAKKER